MQKRQPLSILASWCLYDSASGAFSIIVTTFIFSFYFTTRVAPNEITGTYLWANAISFAGLIIAMTSPLFGAIADRGGSHKVWLFFFTWLCIISSFLLWFVYPKTDSIHFALTCVVFGTIGLEIATVFYNAFLPTLATPDRVGRLSGWGWGCGYLGGILALTLALIFFVHTNYLHLNPKTAEQIRICGPFTAIWYALFSLPLFLFVPNIVKTGQPFLSAIRDGFYELGSTLKKLPQDKNLLIYLISHMIYTDGLNTLFAFGGIYAAGTFGFNFEEVLLFGISMNVTAGIGAITLSWADDFLGSKTTILISLVCLSLFGTTLLLLHSKYAFWGVALLLCLFVGPVQAASRSLMVRIMADKKMSGEMFGLYALSGKITAFIGPWMLGWMTMQFSSQRVGMMTIMLFFIIGALLLLPVKVQQV